MSCPARSSRVQRFQTAVPQRACLARMLWWKTIVVGALITARDVLAPVPTVCACNVSYSELLAPPSRVETTALGLAPDAPPDDVVSVHAPGALDVAGGIPVHHGLAPSLGAATGHSSMCHPCASALPRLVKLALRFVPGLRSASALGTAQRRPRLALLLLPARRPWLPRAALPRRRHPPRLGVGLTASPMWQSQPLVRSAMWNSAASRFSSLSPGSLIASPRKPRARSSSLTAGMGSLARWYCNVTFSGSSW